MVASMFLSLNLLVLDLYVKQLDLTTLKQLYF